jgi:NADH-quinone oxidoreductase subunit A
VYFAAVILLVAGMLALSYLLGQRHQAKAKGEPYESGIVSTGSARLRFPAQFYLVAMLFVVFDLEAVFIFAWAIAFRELGWGGYIGALLFIGVLFAALIYAWRLGILDWGSRGRKSRLIARRRAELQKPEPGSVGQENISYLPVPHFPVGESLK